MERVRGGVEQIRAAAAEQDRGNEVVHSSSVGDARGRLQQVRGTTEEQTRGSGRIRESVEGVREAVEQINSALQEQSTACRSAVELLEGVYTRTRSNGGGQRPAPGRGSRQEPAPPGRSPTDRTSGGCENLMRREASEARSEPKASEGGGAGYARAVTARLASEARSEPKASEGGAGYAGAVPARLVGGRP